VPLKTSGAFHSPRMASARHRLTPLLESVSWKTPAFPVFANTTARPHQGASELARELGDQVTGPVHWDDTIREMWSRGARVFVELGPGKTLSGLIVRIIPEATVLNVCDLATLSRAVSALDSYALGVVS
jgi:[acyl-carrier-protein] S-malonyltransferase